jgi:hypothetical protein
MEDIGLKYDIIDKSINNIRKRYEMELQRLVMDRFKAKGFEFETAALFHTFCKERVTNAKLDHINHLIVDAHTPKHTEVCAFKDYEGSDFDLETGNFTIQISK